MRRLAILLFLFAGAAYANDTFIDRIADSADVLKKGDYAKALKMDERLIKDIVDDLGPGNAATKWFSAAVAHKAIALAGVGRDADAIWYWHVALNIYPEIGNSNLSIFGAPGEFLKKHPLPAEAEGSPVDPAKKVREPVVLKRPEPRYPMGATFFDISGVAIFRVLIDKTGQVRDVWVLKALPAPTLTYCALEALRQWEFRPATADGQAIEAGFNIIINYKLR